MITVCDFLSVVFAPEDIVLIRPVETWTEAGRKRSEVDYEGIDYLRYGLRGPDGDWVPYLDKLESEISAHRARAAERRTNLFFGVCPRFGPDGHFERKWSVRRVRCLWSDVDNCTVAEALERCRKAGLPAPSIVVSSGNGVHLYWILSEVHLVDDAAPPPRVYPTWTTAKDGTSKKDGEHIICPVDREKLPIGPQHKHNEPALSPKAQLIEDVNAGIAAKIGGDSTPDLSRLLRLPQTWNRKDERNGRQPVKCEVVEMHPDRRYAIEEFHPFAEQSPELVRRKEIVKVALPPGKKPSGKKLDRLNELILASQTAPVGTRSEADFALCCYAVEKGIADDELWTRVQGIGKFEAGQDYFARTMEKARQHTREQWYDKALSKSEKKAAKKAQPATAGDGSAAVVEEDPSKVKLLADAICEHDHFAQDAGGKLYRYVGGVYKRQGEEFIKGRVKQLCLAWGMSGEWSTRRAAEVLEFIRVDTPELWERPPMDLLNVKNGLLRIADRVLLPHDPGYLSTVQLPVEFNSDATCPNTNRFVSQVFPADAQMIPWEIIAWLMRPDTSIQKSVMLTGEGSNGKSRWLNQVLEFIGKPNTTAISLHKLESDKYVTARLLGKLANICPDLPSQHLAGTSVFKAITGGDPILAEYKFKDSFEFIPFVRLLFSANHLPQSPDGSHAFFRRWVVIPFDRTFSEEEQIPRDELDAMLTAPGELSGVLNKALDALPRLKKQRGFSEPGSLRKAWREFYSTTDPLAVWLDRYTIDDPDASIVMKDLRVAYNAYAERSGKPQKNEKAFGLELKRLRPAVEKKQKTHFRKLQWCYQGIGLASDSGEDGSHDSHDSHDSSYLVSTQAREKGEGTEDETLTQEQSKGDRVNRVNRVNPEDCFHEYVEHPDGDGMVKTVCRFCGKFLGRRAAEEVSDGDS